MTKLTQELQTTKSEQEGTPANLIQLAIQKDVDVDKLEKLLQLQERWQANEARKLFLEAMSKFQNECPVLEKKKKVAYKEVKYSYASLGDIFAGIKDKLRECGLSYRWEMADKDASISCTCIISHTAGHSERTTMTANKDASGGKNEIQQRGSTITYLQRYTLIGALGISTADEDNDGRTSTPEKPKLQEQAQNKPQGQNSEATSEIIMDMADELKEKIKLVSGAINSKQLGEWVKSQPKWIRENNEFYMAVKAKLLALQQPPVASKGEDIRPWLSDADYKEALAMINGGEDLIDSITAKYRMKKVYKEGLEQATEFSRKVAR